MALNQALLPEFDNEMANTRKTLERAPDSKWEFKPHPKSGTLGWLANHVAMMPGWAASMFQTDSFDVAPGGKQVQMPNGKNRKELLAIFDEGAKQAHAGLAASTDEQLMKPWSLLQNGQPIFTMPRIAVYRSMIMNHLIHHRAQLCVYYRMNDVAVPGLYGPSADEATAAAAK
ncbi:MAG TPA: DinB family protein [Candidatus Limnocylindrales bacterium]|nr:DinB family protein [Candidatus Limnocylindrales bacterium]